jgi:hypothetical protein
VASAEEDDEGLNGGNEQEDAVVELLVPYGVYVWDLCVCVCVCVRVCVFACVCVCVCV